MGGIVDTITGRGARRAGQDAERGAKISADYQSKALDYLKERDRLPAQFRDSNLTRLNDIYSGAGGQERLTEQAMASPLYKTLLEQG